MRKNISSALAGFLAALLLWCLLPVTAEAAGASFSGSGSVRAGDSVTVTFSVSGSNIQGITAVLHYDSSALTLTGTRQLIGDSWSVDMSGGNLLAYDQSLNNPISGSSAVLAVTFRVKSGVAAGTKVSATITDIVTSDGNSDQSLNDASWSASVASPPSGNANLSGLSCGSYALSPSFSAGTTEYSVTVPYDVSRLPRITVRRTAAPMYPSAATSCPWASTRWSSPSPPPTAPPAAIPFPLPASQTPRRHSAAMRIWRS